MFASRINLIINKVTSKNQAIIQILNSKYEINVLMLNFNCLRN